MNATLLTVEGRPMLRIERRFAHPQEKVWRALTEPDHLSQWYPFAVSGMDLRVGGIVNFDDGQGTAFDAVITELDPPRVFAFSERAPEVVVRESTDLIRFELRPQAEGCLLIFTHTFDDRPAAASYASGWTGCLDALESVLDGRPVTWPDSSAELHEAYIEAFGLDAGSSELTSNGWRVRFERQLMQQPIDKVWAMLNASGPDNPTPETGTPVVGGPVPQAFTAGNVASGAVTEVDAPALLEYEWLAEDRPAGRVRWELSNGPGGARIVLTQTGPGELADERPTALAVWQAHIERLAKQCATSR